MVRLFVVLITSILFSTLLRAEMWSPAVIYHTGDVVELDGNSYVASYWNTGLKPIKNKFPWDGWSYIKEKQIKEWKPKKKYKAGRVVKLDGGFYIAKWENRGNLPDSQHSRWVKLSASIENATGGIEKNNVLGNDHNNNGVRDDYERFVEKTYSNVIVKSYLKNIARDYQKVLEVNLDPELAETVTSEQAALMMDNLVSYLRCNRELKKQGLIPADSSPISDYYNTIERAISRHKGERIINRKLDGDYMASIDEDLPCGAISEGVL